MNLLDTLLHLALNLSTFSSLALAAYCLSNKRWVLSGLNAVTGIAGLLLIAGVI